MTEPHNRGTCDNRNDLLHAILAHSTGRESRNNQMWGQLLHDLRVTVAERGRHITLILSLCAQAELEDGKVKVEDIYEVLAEMRI